MFKFTVCLTLFFFVNLSLGISMRKGFVIENLPNDQKKFNQPLAQASDETNKYSMFHLLHHPVPPCPDSEPWARYRVSDLQEI